MSSRLKSPDRFLDSELCRYFICSIFRYLSLSSPPKDSNKIQVNISKNTTPERSTTKNTINLYSSWDFERTNNSKINLETILKTGKINRNRLNQSVDIEENRR